MKRFDFFIKRVFDTVVSAGVLLMLTVIPVLIVIPILIRLTSKGPAFYKQIRIGKNGRSFVLYKFRTMIVEQYDSDGKEIMSEARITKIGRILRKTSLDEIPQLFNVLNGTMSIVGPRPMLDYQAPRCIGEENMRFDVRPGLTGLAQVQGRNNIRWEERIQYDIQYVKNFTFWMDIKIIAKTVMLVFRRDGTDVKPEYRGIDRFSKHYIPEENKQEQKEATSEVLK